MKFLTTVAAAALALLVSLETASAATFTWTEGNNQNRKLVAGSYDLEDADESTPGFELDDLANVNPTGFGANDILQIHGRIVSAVDIYTYSFSFQNSFKVEFDLDGYQLAENLISSNGITDENDPDFGFETLSGLVGQDGRGGDPEAGLPKKGVKFSLIGNGQTIERSFKTDILDGANPFIFGGVGGVEYILIVDGSVGPRSGADALYDLRISAVPVPAAGLLLLTAVAGAGFMGRRRRKS